MISEMHILKVAPAAEHIRCPCTRLVWHVRATADKKQLELILGTTGDACTKLQRFMLPMGLTRAWQKGRVEMERRRRQKSGRQARVSQHLKVCSVRLEEQQNKRKRGRQMS